jgi:hypothetical protein
VKPGIYSDVSEDAYFSDQLGDQPSLSSSIAHTLVSRSPLHAWAQHPRFGARGKKPTREMDLGSVAHTLLLGRGKRFVVIKPPEGEEDYQDFKKKAAREARDAARAAGKIPLLQKHLDEALELAEAIRPRLEEFGFKLTGESEMTALWEERADDGSIVNCRGMIDHLILDSGSILDLKIVRSAHPKACQSHLVGFGGDIQSHAYTSAVEFNHPELAGRVEFTFLFCEAEYPHAVTPVFRNGTMRELGELRWRRAVNSWAKCLKANRWPAYVESPIGVDAPPWAFGAELETSFSDNTMANRAPDSPSVAGSHSIGAANNEYGIEALDDIF